MLAGQSLFKQILIESDCFIIKPPDFKEIINVKTVAASSVSPVMNEFIIVASITCLTRNDVPSLQSLRD